MEQKSQGFNDGDDVLRDVRVRDCGHGDVHGCGGDGGCYQQLPLQ